MEEMNSVATTPEETQAMPEAPTIATKQKKKLSKWVMVLIPVMALLVIVIVVRSILSGMQVVSIKANYDGDTSVGTVLDSANVGISVLGRRKNGDIVNIPSDEWTIASPKTLQPDSTEIVRITYESITCELKVSCTDSNVIGIEAYYDGNLEAGTSISNITEGFHSMATLKNGSKIDITEKCVIVDGPVTIKADTATKIKVNYTDPVNGKVFACDFSVVSTTRTVKRISAKYNGEAKEGEVLDSNNSGFVVTATYNNGDVEVVKGWEIKEPATLVNSQHSTVVISYAGQDCKITVECSVFDPEIYKDHCVSVSYDELARQPEAYEGSLIKIKGKIHYIESGANSSSGYIYHIYTSHYSKSIRVAFSGTLEEGNLIDNDYVTCYGEYLGFDNTDYNEDPLMNARIIERQY